MAKQKTILGKKILLGGSAGSFKTLVEILNKINSANFDIVILAIHRPRKEKDQLFKVFSNTFSNLIEPKNGEEALKNKVYLAPSKKHLRVDDNGCFQIRDHDTKTFSKPSIDVLFKSAAPIWKEDITAVLLSGANEDGAEGVKEIKRFGGQVIIQDPKDCLIDTMTNSAIGLCKPDLVLSSKEIIQLFHN